MSRPPEVVMKTKNSISDDIQKEIALRAYYIWEREGCPEGREAAHWALAEAEVLSEQPAKKAAAVKTPVKAKTNGATKSAKAEAKAEPVKPAEPVKAAVAAKAVKTKKVAKAKKPAPKA
jgi:hypothetical protein